ncbi:putative CRISPR-associated protein [Thermodesulfovibrio sp. 3907-1M]|uniref:CRISPR-associated protein n=1 Tax=Thermodesulfovibrio autotrophicus TaxID=3118333 RepID=A0AAU8GV75_9BACT
MKELHIISTGISLLTNAQKAGIFPERKISDEDYWQKLLNSDIEIHKLVNFLKSSPMKNSAEMNTFLRVVEGKSPNSIEVYLFGTKTASNELCRLAIEQFLKDAGYEIYTPYEISGYFWEAKYYEPSYAIDKFKLGISELLDRLICLANTKKKQGYRVFFNPTGGLKAHVIATALAGILTDCQIYYMNEEFHEVVFLPKLFYLPKGKELELLKKLAEKRVFTSRDYEELEKNYEEEIERLEIYGLIARLPDESQKALWITNRGLLFIAESNEKI